MGSLVVFVVGLVAWTYKTQIQGMSSRLKTLVQNRANFNLVGTVGYGSGYSGWFGVLLFDIAGIASVAVVAIDDSIAVGNLVGRVALVNNIAIILLALHALLVLVVNHQHHLLHPRHH